MSDKQTPPEQIAGFIIGFAIGLACAIYAVMVIHL